MSVGKTALLTGILLLACKGPSAHAQCAPTAENPLGPYYLPGAPLRERLAPPGTKGLPLLIAGIVRDTRCRPLNGALVEFWQAGPDGGYDFSADFRWRATARTDVSGRYRFLTMMPGRYGSGAGARPAHLHLKVTHASARPLVTQVYFQGDPANRTDPMVNPALIVSVIPGASGAPGEARFDITLAP